MRKFLLVFNLVFIYACYTYAQSTGIGTRSPTNKLTVNETKPATDPVRVIGLQDAGTNTIGTIITDNNGVLKLKDAFAISAINYTGSFKIASNNQRQSITSNAPNSTGQTRVMDNFAEFDGSIFKARQAGLYSVTFTVAFNQGVFDDGDGYLGWININNSTSYTKVPEITTGEPVSSVSAVKKTLLQLAAGDTINFFVTTYGGGGGGATGSYAITIVRVD